jgi:hypothetical protein
LSLPASIRRFVQSEPATRLRQAWVSPRGRRIRGRFELILGLVAAAYLIAKLSEIGWRDLITSLPTSPWFYLLAVARLLIVPGTEAIIFGRLWARPMQRRWPVLLRKQAYNCGLLEYSGELYFVGWAPRALDLTASRALVAIRDVNLLSALVMNGVAVVLFAGLAASSEARRLLAEAHGAAPYFALGGGCLIVLTGVGLVLRRRLVGLDPQETRFVSLMHLARILVMLLLQAAQLAVALPSAPFQVWLVFLAANIALTRIPLIPNRDLIFAGLSLSLIAMVDAPAPQAAAALALAPALMQLGYLVTLVGATFARRPAEA